MQTEGIGVRGGDAARVAAGRLHHPHAGPGRARSLLARADRGAPRAAARRAGAHAEQLWAWAASTRRQRRGLLHDGAGAEASRRANAVSSLHGQVSRAMWTASIRGAREEEVPIGHITNGVHVPHLARAADAAGVRPPPRSGLAARSGEPGVLGSDRERRRRRALGDAPGAQARS